MSEREFNTILVNNADFLKPFAVNLTRDADAASDLYQETLYKALANQEKYKPGTNKGREMTSAIRENRISKNRLMYLYMLPDCGFNFFDHGG